MNPYIFTKKNFVKALKTSAEVVAFEHILALVCKLYYKSGFQMDDYLKLFMLDTSRNNGMGLEEAPVQKKTRGKKKGFRGIPIHKRKEMLQKEEDEEELDVS